MKAVAAERKRAAPGVLIFTLLTAVFFWRFVCLRQYLVWGDVVLQFWPWRHFTREMILSGAWPLWNPYIFCGLPFAANPQTGVFYPGNLALLALPAYAAVTWSVVLHVWLCGVFMLLYLRALGGTLPAQVMGACAYSFSGCVIARLQFPNHLVAFAALPGLLWVYELSRSQPGLMLFSGWAAFCALVDLGGHPQVNIIVMTLAFICLLWDSIAAGVAGQSALAARRLLLPLAGLVVGACVAAIQIVPALELLLNSTRTEFSGPQASIFALPPWQQIVWLAPDAFGNPARSAYWGEGNFFEVSPYPGLVTLLLALAALTLCRHRLKPVLIFVVMVGLLLGMGHYGPVYPWLTRNLPVFGSLRGAGRWLLLPVFALSVLAALGWDTLARSEIGLQRLLKFSVILAVALAAAGAASLALTGMLGKMAQPWVEFVLQRTFKDVATETLPSFSVQAVLLFGSGLLTAAIWPGLLAGLVGWRLREKESGPAARWIGALVCGLVFADLFYFGSDLNPTASGSVFRQRPAANPPGAGRIATPESTYIKPAWNKYVSYARFMNPGAAAEPLMKPIDLHLPATNMATGILNAQGYDPLRLRQFERRLRKIERDGGVQPWRPLAVGWVLERFGEDGVHFRPVPHPLPRADLGGGDADKGGGEGRPIRVVDRINRLSAECPARGQWLTLRDVWYPGWEAYGTGRRLRMRTPDGWRVAQVSHPGRIVFVFRNQALIVGAGISFWTVGCLTAIAAAGALRSHGGVRIRPPSVAPGGDAL